MFERFTQPARQAVVLAQEEARRLRHAGFGTEHLLLGVLAEGRGLGARVLAEGGVSLDEVRERVRRSGGPAPAGAPAEPDARALETIGIDLDAVRRKVEETFGPGALGRRPVTTRRWRPRAPAHLPFTPEAKRALELSLREALRLGHRWIGTEHLVLGLLRQERGAAARLLRAAGVEHAAVEERILGALEGGAASG
jgi:ATP-dependent Clp protease ATP-binding subunit ClpA